MPKTYFYSYFEGEYFWGFIWGTGDEGFPFRVSHIFHPLLCHSPSLYACSLKNSSKTHKFARSSLFSWFSRGGTRSLDLINCSFTFVCHVYATFWRCLQRVFLNTDCLLWLPCVFLMGPFYSRVADLWQEGRFCPLTLACLFSHWSFCY